MLILSSFIAAIFPITLYLYIIWKMDKYEPEPLKFVLQHFIWGALGAIIFAILGSALISIGVDYIFAEKFRHLIMTIVAAPFLEEIVKASYLRKTYFDKRLDNITDGLVYGAAIGLGFGMTENFFYFITYADSFEEWMWLVIIRSGFSAVMHCMSTGLVGAFIGYLKYSKVKNKSRMVGSAISLAILIHAFWNLSVSFYETYNFGFVFIIMVVITFIAIFKYSLGFERKVLKNELAGELPESLSKYLSSDLRFRRGWIRESMRPDIIRLSTRLAFRKRQMRFLKNDYHIEKEIINLRERIREIILLEKDIGL
ncbi:MAG: PrsW family intramembrane metalloprotease [Melioribacteraceae bacterium]|nr:PrsW family intramembrane metalloprotease [Melioribacteraceae bacterium]